jgi:hypothetical protein
MQIDGFVGSRKWEKCTKGVKEKDEILHFASLWNEEVPPGECQRSSMVASHLRCERDFAAVFNIAHAWRRDAKGHYFSVNHGARFRRSTDVSEHLFTTQG